MSRSPAWGPVLALQVAGSLAAARDWTVSRIYTVVSTGTTGGWLDILRHFRASLQSSPGAPELSVLSFNVSSPMRIAAVRGHLEPGKSSESKWQQVIGEFAASMSRHRYVAWHEAMLFKAESWARVARARSNAGLAVLCADADHTFFPGWRRVVEDCLQSHAICFEANLRETGSTLEKERQFFANFGTATPNETFWERGWVNTGLFAMRCGPATASFWTQVASRMRLLLDKHGTASDQDSANSVLLQRHGGQPPDFSWAVLDPYAVNQLSWYTLAAGPGALARPSFWERRPYSHARRMLDKMVLHHAAYLGDCQAGTASCKLQLMRSANETWFLRRRGRGRRRRRPERH